MADAGERSVQPRVQAAVWLVAAATSVVLFVGYLWLYDFANLALNNGVDWAHHMVMIDIIATGESWSAPEVISRIGVHYAVYPHSSHYLAAWLAALAGVSPLKTVHWIANAAVIVSAAVAAARLALIVGGARSLVTAVVTPVAAMLLLHFFAAWGVGVSGQLQWVFYYPQAVGSALALICVVGLQRLARDDIPVAALFVATALSAVLVVSFHPTPAIFVAAAGASCALSRQGSFTWRVVQAGGVGLLAAGVVVALPVFNSLLPLLGGTAGGNVNTESHIFNLSLEPMMLLVAFVVLALLLAAALSLLGRDVFRRHAGAVALLACTTAAGTLLVWNHATEYYSVAKYVYLYSIEAPLLLASLVRVLMDRFTAKMPISQMQLAVFTIATVPLAMVAAQKTYVTKFMTDQRPLIAAYAQAKAGEIRKVPRTLGYTERYYLAVSAFHESVYEAVQILIGKRED